jgi:activator of 2-hydroxyglutaryl-CoA dehydratase
MEPASKTSTDLNVQTSDEPDFFSMGIDVGKTDLELALLDKEEQLSRKSVPNDEGGVSGPPRMASSPKGHP